MFLSYFSFEVSYSVLHLARCFAFSVRFLSIKVIDLHHMAGRGDYSSAIKVTLSLHPI